MSRKKNLSAFFDKVDLGVDAIDDWSAFEKKFYGEILSFDRGFDGVAGIKRVA